VLVPFASQVMQGSGDPGHIAQSATALPAQSNVPPPELVVAVVLVAVVLLASVVLVAVVLLASVVLVAVVSVELETAFVAPPDPSTVPPAPPSPILGSNASQS
jgi:hypothetical protein